MIQTLFAEIWPYLAGVASIIAGLFYVRQSGRAAERTEQTAKINKQAQRAQREQRDVENEVAATADADLDSRLGEWVRKSKSGD